MVAKNVHSLRSQSVTLNVRSLVVNRSQSVIGSSQVLPSLIYSKARCHDRVGRALFALHNLSPTHSAVRGAVAFGLSFTLSHVLAALCLPIPSRAGAVINAGVRINPYRYCWVSGTLSGDWRVSMWDRT